MSGQHALASCGFLFWFRFLNPEDTYHRREDYYVTMQANVLAEAVCGFHSGAGNVLLHCRAEYGALSAYRPVTDAAGRRPQVGGQIIGASNNPQNGVTAQQTQSVVTFLGSTGPIF